MKRLVIINVRVITGFAVFDNCGILIEDGIIADVFNMNRYERKGLDKEVNVYDAKGNTATFGLIDTHIHGIGGFGTDDMSPSSILGMSNCLADYGVTSFLPTLYPMGKEKIFAQIDAVLEAMGHEKGAKILGINLEGPFISPKRPGALIAGGLSPVSLTYYKELIERGKGHIVCMTVAPELKGMRELALQAMKDHVVLLAGHTDAQYSNILEGMQCGILHSTHFFNAMRRLHHRDPGAAGAILMHNEMKCEIIADGVHVHPELVKFVIKTKDDDSIVLITDSIKPTGFKEGLADGVKVVLSEEGAFVSKDDPSLLNGSALTLNKAVANVIKWGIDPQLAVKMATENPARIYSFDNIGCLSPGNCADISIFDQNFNPVAVFVNGEKIR